MVPRLTALANERTVELLRFVEVESRKYALLAGDLPRIVLHEGDRVAVDFGGGQREEMELETLSEDLLEIGPGEVYQIEPIEILRRLQAGAERMGHAKEKFFFRRMDETLEVTGQTVSAEGRGFTFETFLEMVSRVDIDFDSEGKPLLPSIVVHPSTVEQVRNALKDDAESRGAIEAIIDQKRIEWLDRQTDRRLVG